MRMRRVLKYLGDSSELLTAKASGRCNPAPASPEPSSGATETVSFGTRFLSYFYTLALSSTDYVVIATTRPAAGGAATGDLRAKLVRRGVDDAITTVSAEAPIDTANTQYLRHSAVRLSSTKFVVIAYENTVGIYGIVCTVTGTTITASARVLLTADTGTAHIWAPSVLVAPGRVLFIWTAPGLATKAMGFSVTGVTITLGTPYTIGAFLSTTNQLTDSTVSGSAYAFISTPTGRKVYPLSVDSGLITSAGAASSAATTSISGDNHTIRRFKGTDTVVVAWTHTSSPYLRTAVIDMSTGTVKGTANVTTVGLPSTNSACLTTPNYSGDYRLFYANTTSTRRVDFSYNFVAPAFVSDTLVELNTGFNSWGLFVSADAFDTSARKFLAAYARGDEAVPSATKYIRCFIYDIGA